MRVWINIRKNAIAYFVVRTPVFDGRFPGKNFHAFENLPGMIAQGYRAFFAVA
jgi:hypothetical protein